MHSERTAVIVIDLQKEFVDADGLLRVEGAERVVERLPRLTDAARGGGSPIVFTRYRGRPQVPAGRTTQRLAIDGLHLAAQAELSASVAAGPDDIVVDKPRQSAFYGTDLDLVLRRLDVGRVVLTGLTTNSCVLATAYDAAARDLDVVAVRDLAWARPVPGEPGLTATQAHEAALAFVGYGLGEVRTLDETLPLLA